MDLEDKRLEIYNLMMMMKKMMMSQIMTNKVMVMKMTMWFDFFNLNLFFSFFIFYLNINLESIRRK